MTSGAKPTPEARRRSVPGAARRRVLALLGACAALLASPAHAFGLGELMTLLAQVRSGEARFTEQRTVQGLQSPLLSSGTLSFAAPDRFTRRTLEPRPESMVVEGNMVTLTRNGRSRTLVLDAIPEVEAIVEAVRGTLTGNAGSLQAHFRTAVAGSAEQWTLELRPIEPRLQALLASVQIVGRGSQLRSVEMRMADGDRSLMQVEPVAAAARKP